MKIAGWLLRVMVWLLVCAGLTAGIVLGRLNSGPVTVDWMKPRVEEALTPGNSDFKVHVGRTELRLDDNRRTIELVGSDVRYMTADNRPFLSFPEVTVALSVEAFLKHGLIAASRVGATAPSLRLTKNEDGIVGLYSGEQGDDKALSDVDFFAFLRHVVLAPASDDRVAFLKRLQISGGHLAYVDEALGITLDAEAADLVLLRQPDGVSGWLRADLAQPESRASLQLLGRVDAEAERAFIDIDADNLVIADLAKAWRAAFPSLPPDLDRLRSPVEASLNGMVDFDGVLSPLDVELRMVDGLVDLPDHLAFPLEVTLAELNGRVGQDFDALDVQQMRLVSRGAELTGQGRVARTSEGPSLELDLAATNVRAEDLPAFWPPGLADDGRSWVIENIKTGTVPRANARLVLRPEDFGPEPLRDEALDGGFTFEGLSIRYVDTMPPVVQGSGKASFDADHLHFEVDEGENAGIALNGGTVTITGLGKPGQYATQLKVLADVEGPIERALALLDNPPLDVAKDLDILPEQTSGIVGASLDVRMPLYNEVTDEEVDVIAEAKLGQLSIDGLPRLGPNMLLEQGAFSLSVGATAVTLNGTATVADLPLEIGIEEPLVEGPAKRRILVKGELNKAMLDRFDIAIEGVDGTVAFDATMTETSDNIWVDLDADLAGLSVAYPGIAWRKNDGEKGRLRASIAVPNDGPIDVKQFELNANGLKAAGSLLMSQAPYRIISLNFGDLQLGNSRGALRLNGDDKGLQEIVVEAEALDLDSLLTDDDGKIDLAIERLDMVMRAGKLMVEGLTFRDVQADASRRQGTWRTASFFGSLDSGDKIALELVPDGDHQRLDIRSDDAGAIIKALGLGERVEGGALHLEAKLTSQDPIAGEGRLEINRFTLTKAPLLARLLTVASLTGIGNLLEGEGIQFDNLIFPFTVQDRRFTLSDGLLRGSQLGLTTKGTIDLKTEILDLAGTIIPIYSINRLIGQVPIIGRILTGSDGRGAFAATYRASGPMSQSNVYVNPLSVLAPGLIRDFFGSLTGGNSVPSE